MANNIPESPNKDKRAKTTILVLTLVLTLVFVILAIVPAQCGISGCGDERFPIDDGNGAFHVSGTLYRGENGIYVSSSITYYQFVPSSSGRYNFYSTNATGAMDPQATLYDSTGSYLLFNDDSESGHRDFRITFNLTAGKTYYLGVKLIDGSGRIYVTVERA